MSCFFLLHASYHFHRFPLWLFVPFPLVSCISCIFNIFFQEFYPSPSVSDRFCTISSGCYRIFLHFHCIFPACLLHRHSLFLAVAPVSSMFQQILHPLFWLLSHFPARLLSHFPSLYLSSIFSGFCTISSDCYHVFLQFLYPLRGFQSIHAFLIYFSKILPVSFLHHFLWFAAFSMYVSKSFTRLLHFPIVFAPFPLVVTAFSCTFTVFFQHVYCIIIVCSSSHSGFLHVPTGFAWFVPSIFLWSLSCFPQVSLYFPIHPLRGFSICFVQHFFTTCFLSFSPLSSIGFLHISSGFLHFHTFSILIPVVPHKAVAEVQK